MSSASKLVRSISKFRASNPRVFEQRRKFSVYNDVQPDPPLPKSQPPTYSLRWILGTAFAIILPVAGNKSGPLIQVKEKVDTVVETIEDMVEVVEKVAEVVDKVAESVSGGLPESGSLKKMLDVVEDVAERTARDAQTIGDAIDKFQEMEEKMKSVVDILGDKSDGNQHTKEAKG